MIRHAKPKNPKHFLYLLLFFGVTFIFSWLAWGLLIIAESSVGFTNHGSSPVSIYKITLNRQSIYHGEPIIHNPGIKPSGHTHYFGFYKRRSMLDMAVYFKDAEGGEHIARQQLDHNTGRYIFLCTIDKRYMFSCAHDDIFDFGH